MGASIIAAYAARTVAATHIALRAEPEVWQNRLLLVGKDTFFGAPGMGPDYDWPNPSVAKWREGAYRAVLAEGEVWSRNPGIYTGADQFFGLAGHPTFDWPNPRGYVPGVSLKTWVDPTKQWLIGQDKFFGLAGNPTFDWPNPRGASQSETRGYLSGWNINLGPSSSGKSEWIIRARRRGRR